HVGAGAHRGTPPRVVRCTVKPRLETQVSSRLAGVVARTHRGRAENPEDARLCAEAVELGCVVEKDVVRVEAREARPSSKADVIRLREQAQSRWLKCHAAPVFGAEVLCLVEVDVA